MDESLSERQENELEVLQAIYLDDFQDLRTKPGDPPKVCLKLTPVQSVVGKEVYARVDLIVQYTRNYPDRSPKISLTNAVGLPNDDLLVLEKELRCMAAELVGEVMVLQLAQHVQTHLHSHNKPQLSFYDEMMTNKRKEEERQREAEQQKLQKEMEATKEEEEEEQRQIQEELMRREEAVKERRRRTLIERGNKMDPISQSIKNKEAEQTSNKDIQSTQRKSVGSQPQMSPKRSDGFLRRRKSSESIGEESVYTGFRVLTFDNKGEHVVHCGECLGRGSSGSRVFSGIDVTSGHLVVVCEWKFAQPIGVRRSLSEGDSSGHLMKQVTSIEQEMVSLTSRVSHPNLLHYLGVNVVESASVVTFQALLQFAGGGDLSMKLKPGGLAIDYLREYCQQILEAVWYLHGKSVILKDIRLTSCLLDTSGHIRLTDYSVGKRLLDLYEVYGVDLKTTHTSKMDKTGFHYSKKRDIYNMGLLILSLATGEVAAEEPHEIPSTLSSELQDFLSRCLNPDERDRWSAYQLLQHTFVNPPIPASLSNCTSQSVDGAVAIASNSSGARVGSPEPHEPIPDFCFFTGVAGKSRIKSDFEQLQFLGKGGFGNVIMVRNKLDGCLYAIKRIPLNPKSTQFNKKIIREVQLISRLNHESVVRYYNSWVEASGEGSTDSDSSKDTSASDAVKPSNEDSLMNLNAVEAPSLRGRNVDEEEVSWCSDVKDTSQPDLSSSEEDEPKSFVNLGLSKSHNSSLFGVSESSDGVVFAANVDDSVLQFGDLLDTESEDSDDAQDWPVTSSESVETKGLQYLYIQMEYCKSTLRTLIDEGLSHDGDRVWRLFREIVEGLAHIHSQGIIHRDLKPVNLFLDAHGQIKIGDFGLATTHGITRGGLGSEVLSPADKSNSKTDGSNTADGMTGKVGTTLYVAPELGKTQGRVKYSQKVDLYSLGIIFFEMCYRPATSMERVHVLGNLRKEKIVFPDDYTEKQLSKQTMVIKWLLQHNPEGRPTSQELLQSQYIPPKIEDGHLDEVLRHTLASSNTTRYRRLMTAMFSQHVSPVLDATYDIDIYSASLSPRAVLAQQMVHETLRTIFTRHGALRLRTSLLVPRTKFYEHCELSVNLVDHSGVVLTLPYDLRVPFARYVAKSKVSNMKRFDIGCVYRDKRIMGVHPKELYECAFDIVTSSPEGLGPDAEVLFSVTEIIEEFPSLLSRNYYIRVNHAGMMNAFLTSCGVPENRLNEFFTILQDAKGDKRVRLQINELLESMHLSEHAATALWDFLDFEGPVSKLRTHLIGVMKRKTAVGQAARQAFHDLEAIESHAAAFGVNQQIVVNTSMVYNIQHFSGLIFQFVAANNRKRKRGGVDILAAGGRYDNLVAHFRRGDPQQGSGAVGVSIAVEKIVAAVIEDQDATLPSACDVLVCTAGHNPMLTERMRIVRDLWSAGIKAFVNFEPKSLEQLQEHCREVGISLMAVLKEQEVGFVRVRSLDKEKITEVRVPSRDLVENLQSKLNSRPETVEMVHAGTKSTITPSPVETNSSSSPVINVSFSTQDKLAWNTRKRYESQMNARIAPIIQHIGSKNAVEVIAVDLPSSVLRSMSELLDLDANEDAFNFSVAAVADKHARYKKHIDRVCDDIRELKVSKKLPALFVYSVKDEFYRIFF